MRAYVERVGLMGAMVAMGVFLLFGKMPSRISAMEKQRKYEGEFYEFAQLFSEVYSTIQDRYVNEVDSKKLFEGAVHGMFAALDDPHSQWLTPDSLSQLEKDTEGEFSGVGLNITLEQGVLTVLAPMPGSPAAKAGLEPWDRIVEIDGKSTDGITLLEAVKKLTGPAGSEVKVKVFREGKTDLMDFTLVREIIHVQSVYSKVFDNEIGYLRIRSFSEGTANEVKNALLDFKKQTIKGIIVDLRYDSGGLLDKAVDICGYFLPKNQLVVSTKGRNDDNNKEFYSKSDPICEVPMVILVNRLTASASEIFAGAMQDTKRGFIVGPAGEKTFGKGSVQTISYLKHTLERSENGEPRLSGLRLTTALYYTPSGRKIHKIGITPDFEVALTREQQRDLARHGMIGDPDMSRLSDTESENSSKEAKPAAPAGDAKKDEKKKDDKPEGEESKKTEPNGKSDEKPTGEAKPPMPKLPALSGAKKEAPEFHDIQLEEGMKYLRMTLAVQQKIKS